jgi:type III pantothenate kinase
MSSLDLIAISVGNTRTHIGLFRNDELDQTADITSTDRAKIVELVTEYWKACAESEKRAVAMASVNEMEARELRSVIEDQLGDEVYEVGSDIPVPIGLALDPEATPGVDRLLCAAASWDLLKQACVVINAGTAVSIDFIDGEGVFHGGVIGPGVQMQLEAMHTGTDALPQLNFAKPDGEPFGRNTASAMQRGVYHGVRGLAWRMVEEFALAYEAFPLVIATGGNATDLFKDDELVNRLIPELELRGIAVSTKLALTEPVDAEE